ncbi:MAG: transcriptional repressor [Flavobacteriales bacterium]|nr:transcriptional repressor [Flavobacteriales bacterium]
MKEKQVRSTAAKQHIREILEQSGTALSQPEIQEQSEGVCDRVTVYRVLDRLLQEGEVHKTIGLDGMTRYAICKACDHDHGHQHDHVHFSCEVCGEVTCLDKVIPELKLPRGYRLKEASYMISGVCPTCN